jgi:hypothetical protein
MLKPEQKGGLGLKKLLLGIVLLALLGAVSYLKVIRDSERQADAYLRGHEAGVLRAELSDAQTDSLEMLLAQKDSLIEIWQAALKDSLQAGADSRAELTDSLAAVIALKEKEIASLKKKRTVTAQKSASKPSTTVARTSDHEILAAYQQAVAKLPKDLSEYERNVALREIREETARKFAISTDRLNQIRKNNSLDY